MADVDGGILSAEALVEHGNVIGAAALNHGAVAALAGAVKQPLTQLGGGVGTLLHAGIRLVIVVGQSLQVLAGLVASQDLLSQSLGGFLGSGFLFLGGLHGLAIGVSGGGGSTQNGNGLIGHAVVAVLVSLVSGVQLGIGVLQAVDVRSDIVAVLDNAHQLLGKDLLAHEGAVGGGEIVFQTVAVGGSGGLQGLQRGIILGLDVIGIGVSFRGGLLLQLLHGGHLLRGLVQEVVMPGGTGLGAQHAGGGLVHGLALQGCAGAQAQVAGDVIVVVHEVVVAVPVIELHLGGGVLLTVDGHGGGVLGDDVGTPHNGDHHSHCEQHADQGVQAVAAFFFLLPGLLLHGLGIHITGSGLLLTELLFS